MNDFEPTALPWGNFRPVERVRVGEQEGSRLYAQSMAAKQVATLELFGQVDEWYLVKGGKLLFYTLYDPLGNRWLKVGGVTGKRGQLEVGAAAQKQAMVVAGLAHLADTVQMTEVFLEGERLPAMVTPHLGQSLEFMLRQDPSSARQYGWVLEEAYRQAQQLLGEHRMLYRDPNPGNIVFPEAGHPLLIDFTQKGTRVMGDMGRPMAHLERTFREQAHIHGIPFVGTGEAVLPYDNLGAIMEVAAQNEIVVK